MSHPKAGADVSEVSSRAFFSAVLGIDVLEVRFCMAEEELVYASRLSGANDNPEFAYRVIKTTQGDTDVLAYFIKYRRKQKS